jgi:hypothetical protein
MIQETGYNVEFVTVWKDMLCLKLYFVMKKKLLLNKVTKRDFVGFEVLTTVHMKSPACHLLLSCLAHSSTQKMEVTCSSKMLINFQ